MKNITKLFAMLSIIMASNNIFAQEESNYAPKNIDDFLKHISLPYMVHNSKALLIGAQFKDPNASSTRVADFDDFIATSSILFNRTMKTEFDKNKHVVTRKVYNVPWIGVDLYQQKDIPDMTLQEGLNRLPACAAAKKIRLPSDQITQVFIYKSILSQDIVYNYEFKDPNLPSNLCKQILYIPAAKDCEEGMVDFCHLDLKTTVN